MNIEPIINNPLFQKLKTVVENNPYHNHESVYDHLIKTYEKANKEITGNLITNPQAKERFNTFLDQEVGGIKKKDLIPLIAIAHDIGKMLSYKEDGKIKTILQTDGDGNTKAPGDEYAGSTIAKEVLSDANLLNEAVEYIAKGIRLHDAFNHLYQENSSTSAEEILEAMKQKSEGMHFEMIFNGLCDNYTAPPFAEALPIISEILNIPETYSSRRYFIK